MSDTVNRVLLLIISSLLSVLCGWLVYVNFLPDFSTKKIVFDGRGGYEVSYVTRAGYYVSDFRGPLHLRMDPYTIYSNLPNQKSKNFSINHDGLRTTIYPKSLTGKEKKIALLGGSGAFGFGLNSDKETISSFLAFQLKNVQVLNAGVIGFLSGQELSFMIHYLDKNKPDLYIIYDGWNDLIDQYLIKRTHKEFLGYSSVFMMTESILAKDHEDKVQARIGENQNSFSMQAKASLIPNIWNVQEDIYLEKIANQYADNLIKMKSFATSRGANILVVFQPDLINSRNLLSKKEKNINKIFEKQHRFRELGIYKQYNFFLRQVKKILKNEKVSFVDINEVPDFRKSNETLFIDPVHTSKTGNRIIAKILSKKIISDTFLSELNSSQ